MLDAIALGELLIDFATVDTDRDGYPTLAAHPGGAPGNFLAALHAYGCSGAMLGKVGADTFGDLLCATLAQAGIRTEGIVRDPSVFTTLAFVTFGPGGERAFSFARKPGADTQLRFDELDLSLLDEARLLHFGSLSLTQEPVRSATPQASANRIAVATGGRNRTTANSSGSPTQAARMRVSILFHSSKAAIARVEGVDRFVQLLRAEVRPEDIRKIVFGISRLP